MADVTKDFTGAASTTVTSYDANFTTSIQLGTLPVLDGSGNLEQDATFDAWHGYYSNSTGEHQKSTVNISWVSTDTGNDYKSSPTVRTSTSNGGYKLNYANNGTTVSNFSLRRYNGVSGGSTFVVSLTTIASVNASTFYDVSLEAEDIDANTVRITATVNGDSESYDDTSASRIHTGEPGIVIGSWATASEDKINTFTTQDLATGSVAPLAGRHIINLNNT